MYIMEARTLYGKGPQRLLWSVARSACGNVTVSRIHNDISFSVIFMVYT
jgi:hypothetical protein